MLFRHPNKEVRIASTAGGHVAIVDTEWSWVHPVLHAEAMAAGCECDEAKIVPNVKPQSSAEAAARPVDSDQVIREALQVMLVRDEDGDFTADKNPNTNVVSKIGGMSFRKVDVMRVFNAMTDDAIKQD